MAFNISKLAVDGDKAVKGTWVDAGEGLRLLIARFGNPEYQKFLNAAMEPIRQTSVIGVADIDTSKVEAIQKRAVAHKILLGWENLQDWKRDDKGKIVEPREVVDVVYSPDAAEKFFERYPDFYEIVLIHARSRSAFIDKAEQENAKN